MIRRRGDLPLGACHKFEMRMMTHYQYFTGYKGRTGLYEFFVVTKRIKDLIIEGTGEDNLKKVAQEEGMKTIFQHGIEKVNLGITTMEEVLKATVLEKS